MKLFIWSGEEMTGAYGRDGVIAVAADGLEQARQFLLDYARNAPSLVRELPESADDAESRRRWRDEVYRPAYTGNRAAVAAYLAANVVIATRGLEPPGSFIGDCYHWNWDWLLSAPPSRVVDLEAGILFAGYGYEG